MTQIQQRNNPEPGKAPRAPDVDSLIPDAIATVVLAETKPETVFAQLRDIQGTERPQVLCVDARDAVHQDTRKWIDVFNALVEEQDGTVAPNLVDVIVVVFLAAKESLEPFSDLLKRPDFDWILTDDRQTPLETQYRDIVRKDLTAFMTTDPLKGLDREPGSNGRPIEDFLPADELEDWKQRLRELGHKES